MKNLNIHLRRLFLYTYSKCEIKEKIYSIYNTIGKANYGSSSRTFLCSTCNSCPLSIEWTVSASVETYYFE
jgi:hypothetical protein